MHKIVTKALGMAAIMGVGIGGYMLLQKKKPEMVEGMKDMADNAKDKAVDFMNDIKN